MIEIDKLKKIKFFAEFPENYLLEISQHCQENEYGIGIYIGKENEPATHLYFLYKGILDLIIQLPGGKPVTAITMREGEMFGWSALVKPYRLTSAAITKEPSIVITIEANILREIFMKDAVLGYVFMEKIATIATERLRDARQDLLSYIYHETS